MVLLKGVTVIQSNQRRKIGGFHGGVDARIMTALRCIGLWLVLLMIPWNCVEADLVPEVCRAGISLTDQFQRYRVIGESPEQAVVVNASLPESGPGPGRNLAGRLGHYSYQAGGWRFRRTTYELLFPNRADLSETIYQLAIFSGDLDAGISKERFQNGAQGFHYSMDQILDWANSRPRNRFLMAHPGEDRLLLCLLLDGVIKITDGRFYASGRVRHVLGAAPGIRRSLALNLNHERWHILWDEDLKFRARYVSKWEALTTEKQKAVYDSLNGYGLDNEMSVIEEWAVRQQESSSLW